MRTCRNPEENAQLRTAPFGTFQFEELPTLTEDGQLTEEANPWAKQWVSDLKEMLQVHNLHSVGRR